MTPERTRDDVRAEFVEVTRAADGARSYVYPSDDVCLEILRLRAIEAAAAAVASVRRISPERMTALREALNGTGLDGFAPTPDQLAAL